MADHGIRLDDDAEEKKDETSASPSSALLEKLIKSRTIIVSKMVDDDLTRSVIAQLLAMEQDDPDKPITVLVNSPGGSADCGFAIHDAMKFVSCPVRTVTIGLSASAGVMISLGGDPGMRFATPNSRYLLHQPSMRTMGQASDIEIVAGEITRVKLQYNSIVAEATKKDLKEIEKDVNRDFWLSAEKSVEYGLVDRLITSRADLG